MKPPLVSGPVTILRDCLDTLARLCEGPVEQGGHLLGTRSPRGCLIYGALPLSRSLRTPLGFLPERWRPSRGRGEMVGWFHSHPGRDVHLSRADVRVHRHLFPRGDGLALVLGGIDRRPGTALALYTGSPPRAVEVLRVL
ncbi:MAG: hypothetical protein QXO51_06325 [Halobacteria archaeon]